MWFKSPSERRGVNDADDGLMQRAFIYNYRSLASTWAHLPRGATASVPFTLYLSQQPSHYTVRVFADWDPEVNLSYCHGFLWSSIKDPLKLWQTLHGRYDDTPNTYITTQECTRWRFLGRSVHHVDPDWNSSATVWWISIQFCFMSPSVNWQVLVNLI